LKQLLSAGENAEPGEATAICRFRIAGGKPGARVSWEVKGVRNDRWVRQRGAPVEIAKNDQEMGAYLHPDLYGQPPEKASNHLAKRPQPVADRHLSQSPESTATSETAID